MKIVFVVHDLSLTGAPKIGLDMAAIMAEDHDVYLVSKKDGPLLDLAKEKNFKDVRILRTSHEYEQLSLSSRVACYHAYLEEIQPDYVYINSVASADWAPACRERGLSFALHGHEMSAEIKALAIAGIFKLSDAASANLIISASEECARDTRNELHLGERPIYNFGVGIDCAMVSQKAQAPFPKAVNILGNSLNWPDSDRKHRKLVAMCGVACKRKGSDLFWQLAKNCPDFDFLWIGPWDDEIAHRVNPALTLNKANRLNNLYWTNMLSNPYPALKASDLFMLSSREDPNPLVVPEAMSFGLPVCTFSDTGGSRVWTERFGFSMAGEVDLLRMENFLRRFFDQDHWTYSPSDLFLSEADIHKKTKRLLDKIQNSIA